MNFIILTVILLAFAIASCNHSGYETEKHDEHEEIKFQMEMNLNLVLAELNLYQ